MKIPTAWSYSARAALGLGGPLLSLEHHHQFRQVLDRPDVLQRFVVDGDAESLLPG